jgi:hypothetical protein
VTLPGTSPSPSNHRTLDPWPNTARSCPRCGGCYRKTTYKDATGCRRHHHRCDDCGATSSDPAVRAISIERSRCHITVPFPRFSIGTEADDE